MEAEIGLRKFRLVVSEGPRFVVDEAAVMESWVGKDGKKKKKVVLKETGGQVFEADEEARFTLSINKKYWRLMKYRSYRKSICDNVNLARRSSWVKGGEKKMKFKSSDGVVFEVDQAVAKQSPTILFVVQANCTDSVPVLKIDSKILDKVLRYCSKHVHCFFAAEAAAKNWDAGFVKVDPATSRTHQGSVPFPTPPLYKSLFWI
ncbi:hypothetical protein BAE44_0000278 [Dichanthelium oligosanthes]|uniref:SKP1 component POZ domain-containing protein n=1 Tax=Dichanthelium oligosanthes TaxID=888268 RepID=A0A1E5WMR2_9POAL|nr:hypothetical protein BAE44_0000278 [Dichanthelium oligosanthes]